MLPLWLLLPLVDGVSQNVSDYCKETQARRPQRANVVLALRGDGFQPGGNGPLWHGLNVEGTMIGYSVGTTSCNVGTTNLNWFSSGADRHPLIINNMYRVKDGAIEQIGVSWVKHGFCALQQTLCGSCQSVCGGCCACRACCDVCCVASAPPPLPAISPSSSWSSSVVPRSVMRVSIRTHSLPVPSKRSTAAATSALGGSPSTAADGSEALPPLKSPKKAVPPGWMRYGLAPALRRCDECGDDVVGD